jgi:hypothetical protein
VVIPRLIFSVRSSAVDAGVKNPVIATIYKNSSGYHIFSCRFTDETVIIDVGMIKLTT